MSGYESQTTILLGPFRIVTGVTFYRGVNCPNNGGRVLLRFDCGHEKVVKYSKRPKSLRARCPDCRAGISSRR